MHWDYVSQEEARKAGLVGPGDLREKNDCIYKRDEHGDWWELQIPPLPQLRKS